MWSALTANIYFKNYYDKFVSYALRIWSNNKINWLIFFSYLDNSLLEKSISDVDQTVYKNGFRCLPHKLQLSSHFCDL